MKPRLLDLFCGAGGAAVGYHRAGFEVVGVDINPQPRYPFRFVKADALDFPLKGFDVVHASPPCQAYSSVSGRARKGRRASYPDLIALTRFRLVLSGLPYVIENVPGSPLIDPFVLCGSSFGLNVRRHRLFEAWPPLKPSRCNHGWQTPRFRSLDSRRRGLLSSVVGVHGHLNYPGEFELRCEAMGVNWMNNRELTQSIPPAYTEYIGAQLMAHLMERVA